MSKSHLFILLLTKHISLLCYCRVSLEFRVLPRPRKDAGHCPHFCDRRPKRDHRSSLSHCCTQFTLDCPHFCDRRGGVFTNIEQHDIKLTGARAAFL